MAKKPEDIPCDDQTAAELVADLLAIEHEIAEQQDAKGTIYKAARETYGKRFANGLKLAVKKQRMDQDQVSEADEVDAEAERILAAYRKPRAPRATRSANPVPTPDHDPETGEITEQQSAPAARDLTSDLIPQGDSGQVATHTPEMANAKEQAETTHSDPQWSGAAARKDAEPLAPTYAEPGEVVMESCPPVGIVAHPYAACWPVREPDDVTGGVREPIVKTGHIILDGRGRYFAARRAGIEYPVVQYAGDDDLADSITWNLTSRPNMDPRALRIVAEKLAKLVPNRAEEIMGRFGFNEQQRAAE